MNRRYPWDRLKKPGDSFTWKQLADERSLRSQANKQASRRGVVYRVTKRFRPETPPKPYALVVTFVNCLLS